MAPSNDSARAADSTPSAQRLPRNYIQDIWESWQSNLLTERQSVRFGDEVSFCSADSTNLALS
jgi:hypothetical protein